MHESAAEVLLRARTRARLTQGELAARAGVTQSVVSAYERGRREPTLGMLHKLVDATGGRLVIDYEPPARTVPLLEHVRAHREELIAALAARGAHNIRVFGSAARGDERPDSDVDLLVDLDDGKTLLDLIGAEQEAERIIGTSVDLIPFDGLKPLVRESAIEDMVPL